MKLSIRMSIFSWIPRMAGIALVAATLAGLILAADDARSQVLLVTLDNPNPVGAYHFFGVSLAMGDADGDGRADILVGSPSEGVGGKDDQGRVYLFSGATGALLRTLDTPNPQAYGFFGDSLAMDDADGDGRADLLVGADGENVGGNIHQGRAYLFSGATGALLRTLDTPNPQVHAEFGFPVAMADADGDGRADLLVGASDENVGGNIHQGRAYLFSGASGALLHTLDSPNPQAGAWFGRSLAVGDADGDGKADIAVGAPQDVYGRVYLFSGVTAPTPTPTPKTNGKIAFDSDRDGNIEIYVMNADGSGQTNLSNNPAWDSDPAWSPDGTKIAFDSDRKGNFEVYVMNADGTGPTSLTWSYGAGSLPDWSPDGTKIAFVSTRDGDREIYVMNADGTGQINLTHNPASDSDPAWSPDGTKIAFDSDRDGNFEVYVMNADGTGQTRLTNDAAIDNGPAWSPDGAKIAFRSDQPGTDIFVMNGDGTGVTRLTSTSLNLFPAWSPDGQKIVFESGGDDKDTDISVMRADGTGQTRLTNSPVGDAEPDWQPLSVRLGDGDCSGTVDAVDALFVLRHVAGLASAAGCISAGNVDCDFDIDSVDALFILRHVALLPVTLPQGCPQIGY